MISARLVGSIVGNAIDRKYFGGQGRINERVELLQRGLFYVRLVRVLTKIKKTNSKALAEEIAEAVRAETPVDTGALRDSVRVVEGENGSRVVVGGTSETMKPITAGGPATFDVALGIEYGTTKRPATPFYWPTVTRYEKKIEKSLGKAIEDEFS